MKFKDWLLLTEKAERTSSKVPLYPVQYHTKQYSPLYHAPYAADYPVWLHLELKPYKWQNYESAFKDPIQKPSWPIIDFDTQAHAHTQMHPKTWDMPD
jgi:hypothetical protein